MDLDHLVYYIALALMGVIGVLYRNQSHHNDEIQQLKSKVEVIDSRQAYADNDINELKTLITNLSEKMSESNDKITELLIKLARFK